jgi:hypothetical protein
MNKAKGENEYFVPKIFDFTDFWYYSGMIETIPYYKLLF